MDDGMQSRRSAHGVEETLERLQSLIAARGMQIAARIDHAAAAHAAGLELRPTVALIFGAAKGGTPLMQANQRVGIDLPMRALVWQDAEDAVWLTYVDPAWIARLHGLDGEAAAAAARLLHLLAELTEQAAAG